MRDILNRMRDRGALDEARGVDNKAMFNDLKKLIRDLSDGMKVLDKHQTKELEKEDPEASAAIFQASKDLNSAYHTLRKAAVGIGVMAGR